jgi:hypothetical protein
MVGKFFVVIIGIISLYEGFFQKGDLPPEAKPRKGLQRIIPRNWSGKPGFLAQSAKKCANMIEQTQALNFFPKPCVTGPSSSTMP